MCVVTIECFSFGFGCKKMSKQAWHWKYRTEIVMQRWLCHNIYLGAKKERKKDALESILLMIYYVLFLLNWVPGWYFTSQLFLQNDSLSSIIMMMIVIVFCLFALPSLQTKLKCNTHFAFCVYRSRARVCLGFTVQRRVFPKENESLANFQKNSE